jgi:hypothetical protein
MNVVSAGLEQYRGRRSPQPLTSPARRRGVCRRRRFGRDISIFDRYLRAPARTLACGHNPSSAVRNFHPGQDDLQLRDAGRFHVGVGRQIRSRKNHQEALGGIAGLAEARLLPPQAGGDGADVGDFAGAKAVDVGRAGPFLPGRAGLGRRSRLRIPPQTDQAPKQDWRGWAWPMTVQTSLT